MTVSMDTPSSGPSGHLLPAGEKEEYAASSADIEPGTVGAANISFSPTGRRWPEGPDEGATTNINDITKRRAGKTLQARRLRRAETEEEYRLWSDLRDRRLNGFKFSRQIPLGAYIVDFLCRERCLIVEVDGFQHAGKPADDTRTQWLSQHGYSVLRFWNHEITQERCAVLETILAALNGRLAEYCEATRFYPAIPAKKQR